MTDAESSATEPQYGLAYPSPFADLAAQICDNATRELRIISPRLDHRVFDNAVIADAVSALARHDSHSRVRILVGDARALVQQGHRLLNLARRLPGSIEIRKLERHPDMKGQCVIIRDLSGVLYMPPEEQGGFYEPDSRASAQQYIDSFDALWERGVVDPDFRRLGI